MAWRRFYLPRSVWVSLAVLAPLVVLGGAWWLVTQLVLAPRVPDAGTTGDRVARFILHERGLPRLSAERQEAFLAAQVPRLIADEGFRGALLAEYRVSSPEQQRAFRVHLFDAFKPVFMRDVRRYHELKGEEQGRFVDERIVTYNRMNALRGNVTISKDALGPVPSSTELTTMLMERTTEEERQRAQEYVAALAERILAILADPALKADFDARIAAVDQPG